MSEPASSHSIAELISASDLRAAVQAIICLTLATLAIVGAFVLVQGGWLAVVGLLFIVLAVMNAREIGRR